MRGYSKRKQFFKEKGRRTDDDEDLRSTAAHYVFVSLQYSPNCLPYDVKIWQGVLTWKQNIFVSHIVGLNKNRSQHHKKEKKDLKINGIFIVLAVV